MLAQTLGLHPKPHMHALRPVHARFFLLRSQRGERLAPVGFVDHLKAMLAVLPKGQPVYAVGGVGAGNMKEWRKAGALGR